jgi:hypothetical protein
MPCVRTTSPTRSRLVLTVSVRTFGASGSASATTTWKPSDPLPVQEAAPAVALARGLLSDPQVLFFDEPTSGLDPAAARDVHELVDGLRQRGVRRSWRQSVTTCRPIHAT